MMIDDAVAELAPLIGKRAACRATGRPQASYYRRHRQSPAPPPVLGPKRAPRPQPRALSEAERAGVRAVLNSADFADQAPAEVYHQLLDEGVYLCSPSSMYRILREHGEVRERRRHATHPAHVKPELLTTAPNQVWSWDITRLRGPAKRVFYHLYSIIDIYSRYTVGWMVAGREDEYLAERLIADTLAKQNITAGQLTIHADRGRELLVQHEEAEENTDGGFEGHQGPERGVRHLAQREQLERERQDGKQDGQPCRRGEDAEGEVAGGLWDADDRGGSGGDGDGEGESADAGEAVADPLGEQDVGGPTDGGECGEP
jgi:transposase InsO family protein